MSVPAGALASKPQFIALMFIVAAMACVLALGLAEDPTPQCGPHETTAQDCHR